ncbi:MAG: hypothetical protein Q9M94_00945 [Candidatus Gracilibacteria bacterium]|nr:hypothetical protein [Candidatus Gracilibacteria bacterium]
MKNLTNKKLMISSIIIILTIVFIYGMTIISEDNKCSGVRSFNSECN